MVIPHVNDGIRGGAVLSRRIQGFSEKRHGGIARKLGVKGKPGRITGWNTDRRILGRPGRRQNNHHGP